MPSFCRGFVATVMAMALLLVPGAAESGAGADPHARLKEAMHLFQSQQRGFHRQLKVVVVATRDVIEECEAERRTPPPDRNWKSVERNAAATEKLADIVDDFQIKILRALNNRFEPAANGLNQQQQNRVGRGSSLIDRGLDKEGNALFQLFLANGFIRRDHACSVGQGHYNQAATVGQSGLDRISQGWNILRRVVGALPPLPGDQPGP